MTKPQVQDVLYVKRILSKEDQEWFLSERSGLGKTDDERRVEVTGEEKEIHLSNLPRVIYEKITELGKAEAELYIAVARPVALQLIELRDGKIPGYMTLEQLTQKLAKDKSFRAVTKPLLDDFMLLVLRQKQRSPVSPAKA